MLVVGGGCTGGVVVREWHVQGGGVICLWGLHGSSVDVGGSASVELVNAFCCLGDMLGVDEMLVQLWRTGFELDGMSLGNWCRCLPVGINR